MSAPAIISSGTASGGPPVGGTGTTNTIPRWTGPSTLGDSIITQNTAANAVGVGATVNSTWAAGWRAVQIGQNAAIWAETSAIDGRFSQNVVWTGSAFNYLVNGAALMYAQNANGHAWSYAGAGTAGNPITFTTGMVLNSSGNVGIGTATPNSTAGIGLTIYQAAAGSLYLQNATDIARIFQQPTNLYIDSSVGSASGSIIFRRGSTVTESARIDSSGNFGIGTASPNAALGIARAAGLDAYIETAGGGRVTGTSSVLYGQDSAGNGYVWNRANAGVFFGTNAQSRWQINTSGHFLAGADNSYDIGASGATRPRIVYVGTGVVGGYIRAGAASAGVASTTTIGNGTSTTATAGAETLPANPLGFIIAHVGTTEVRIPYYAV